MAKRGPQPKAPDLKVIAGTDQPCREQGSLFQLEASEVPEPPAWLKGAGLKLWHQKVERYARRGQPIKGYEDALAHYCAFEADLVDKRKKKIAVPSSAYATLRAFCNDFFDSPAAAVARGQPTQAKPTNPFSAHGKPPAKS